MLYLKALFNPTPFWHQTTKKQTQTQYMTMCQNFSNITLHSRNLFSLLGLRVYSEYTSAHINHMLLCTRENFFLKDTKRGYLLQPPK